MTLQFKKTTDDPRKVIKSFEDIGDAVTAIPTENCSILSPVWLLAYNSDYKGATHVTCPALGERTFFITDIVLAPGGKCYVYGSVDVLATYGDLIKERTGTVIRSESIGAPTLIPDGKLPIQTNKLIVDCDNFPKTPFDVSLISYQFILTTIGGSEPI